MKHVIPNPRPGRPAPKTEGPAPEPGAKKLRLAAILLWVVAVVQILGGVLLIVRAPEEQDENLAELLHQGSRVSIHSILAAPPEKRVEFDQLRESAILNLRLWHACDVAAGLALAGCAYFLRRRPLAATLGALVLLIALTATKSIFGPPTPLSIFLVRILLSYAAVGAILAVLVARREQPAVAT
jgi:hypothetical protein